MTPPQQDPSSPAATGGTELVPVISPDGASSFFGMRSPSGSDFEQLNVQQPLGSALSSTTPGLGGFVSFVAKSKEEQAVIGTIWKQVVDPAMEYCRVRACSFTNIGFA